MSSVHAQALPENLSGVQVSKNSITDNLSPNALLSTPVTIQVTTSHDKAMKILQMTQESQNNGIAANDNSAPVAAAA